ncbi:MAG: hypothetical protein ABII27_09440 [bacterium]
MYLRKDYADHILAKLVFVLSIYFACGVFSLVNCQDVLYESPIEQKKGFIEPQLKVILPKYISKVPSIDNFNLFANGGWDGQWYVGNNKCWIQKLNIPEQHGYVKAFIGAKLGRMKSKQFEGKSSWIREPIPGSIFIAINSEPAWNDDDTFFLTETKDIPLEGDPENAINGVGESRWFWRAVPLEKINFSGDNYIALLSNSIELDSAEKSPILAAGWGDKEVDTWLNDEVNGMPPKDPEDSLKIIINYFEPAIAIKLIPANNYKLNVGMTITHMTKEQEDEIIISAFVAGINIEKVWLEYSKNKKKWGKLAKSCWNVPYQFSINKENSPSGKYFVRVVAVDELGNEGISTSFQLSAK